MGRVTTDEGEIAATARTGHLPCQHAVHGAIAVDIVLHAGLYHRGEHRHLGIERSPIGRGKGVKVTALNRVPAAVGGTGKGLHLLGGDVLTLHHATARAPREHWYHAQVILQPAEYLRVTRIFYLLGPETAVVVVPGKARYTDADGILGATDNAVAALGRILEAEDQTSQHFGVHIGQAIGPHALDDIARARGQPTTLTHLKRRLQRDGQCPTRGMARDIGLVNPGARQVQAGGQLASRLLEVGTAAGIEALGGLTFEHNVLHAPLTAQLALLLTVAVLVDHQAVRMDDIERGQEIEKTVTRVDIGLLDIADGTHHEQALTLAVKRLVTLQMPDCLVTTDAHIQVAILRRLPEELHMARVQQVVAPRHKNFLIAHCSLNCFTVWTTKVLLPTHKCSKKGGKISSAQHLLFYLT